MAVRRWGASVVLVLAMVAGLAACDPPAGSGLTIKATTKTTGLNPGDVIEVRVAGADPGQRVSLFACARAECNPISIQRATAGRDGAVTVRWKAAGTAGSVHWGRELPYAVPAACRPPGACTLHLAAGWSATEGPIDLASTSVPYTLKGRQVQFTATPTHDLEGGERVTVRGTALGAEGRKVRIARIREIADSNSPSIEKIGASVYATVRSDGSFSATYTMPANPNEGDCGGTGPATNVYCNISAWVVKADRPEIDPTFGKPMIGLTFADE